MRITSLILLSFTLISCKKEIHYVGTVEVFDFYTNEPLQNHLVVVEKCKEAWMSPESCDSIAHVNTNAQGRARYKYVYPNEMWVSTSFYSASQNGYFRSVSTRVSNATMATVRVKPLRSMVVTINPTIDYDSLILYNYNSPVGQTVDKITISKGENLSVTIKVVPDEINDLSIKAYHHSKYIPMEGFDQVPSNSDTNSVFITYPKPL